MTAYIIKNTFVFSFLLLVSLCFVSPSYAAAPDGAGPWADSVLSSSQGLTKGGAPVPASRSNPSSALGVAEDNTIEGNFYSLGFGGTISLGFDNGISSGVILVEATNPGYPSEKVKVEISENGTTWVNAGEITQDGSVNKPSSIVCAKYVRITDISNPSDFTDETADAYDVDGVKAVGDPCKPKDSCASSGCCASVINQENVTNVTTTIDANSNTGKNTATNNSGGSTNLQSGESSSATGVAVGGATNSAIAAQCCEGSATNAQIKNNGVNSKNIIKSGKVKAPKKK